MSNYAKLANHHIKTTVFFCQAGKTFHFKRELRSIKIWPSILQDLSQL